MEIKPKYLGLLKGHYLGESLFDEKNLTLLHEKKIIVPLEELDESEAHCYWGFGNNKSYTISSDFLNEVYQTINFYVTSFENNNTIFWFLDSRLIKYDFNDICNDLEVVLDNKEKINIIKSIYSEINYNCLGFECTSILNNLAEMGKKLQIREPFDFPIRRLYNFYLQKDANSIKEWKEWVFKRFADNIFLKQYLTFEYDYNNKHDYDYFYEFIINFKFLDFDLMNVWSNFKTIEKTNDFLISKKVELESEINKHGVKNNKPKTLKSLFLDQKKYDSVLKLLLTKEIIEKKDNIYSIIIPEEYKKRGKQHYICAIGENLKGSYLPIYCPDPHIAEAFNQLFDKVFINKQNFDELRKSPNFKKYISPTEFLSTDML